MRKFGFTLIGLFAAVGFIEQSAIAELKVPRFVHSMEELGKATKKAAKENKPLIFVYTDPGST